MLPIGVMPTPGQVGEGLPDELLDRTSVQLGGGNGSLLVQRDLDQLALGVVGAPESPLAAIDLGHECAIDRKPPGAARVEYRVFIGGVLGAPAKFGRQLGRDKVTGYRAEDLGCGEPWADQAPGPPAHGKVQHQVGVSAALVAVDDLGVFRCSGQVQLERRLSDGVLSDLESGNAELQPATGAGQALFAQRFSDRPLLRGRHRAVAYGQDVNVAATCVEPAQHGRAVQIDTR
jgi:hypothetical protein